MKRILVRAAVAVTGTVVVLVILVAALLSTLDPNDFVGDLTEAISAELGRKVEIKGGIEGSLFDFDPDIVVRDVRLANFKTGTQPDMFRIKAVRLHFSLWSIFKRQFVVHRVEIDTPTIFLEVDKSGARNWEFLMKQSDQPDAKSDVPFVGLLSIRNIRVQYRDRKLGDTFDLSVPRIVQSESVLDDSVDVTFQANTNLGEAKVFVKAASFANLFKGATTALTVRASVGRNDINGRLMVRIGKTISATGDLKSTRIDLVTQPASAKPRAAQRGRTATKKPTPVRVPRALLLGVQANIAYSAKVFRTELDTVTNLVGRLAVKDQAITLRIDRAQFPGARLAGQAILAPTGALTVSSRIGYSKGTLRSTIRLANVYDLAEFRRTTARITMAQGSSDLSGTLQLRITNVLNINGTISSRLLDLSTGKAGPPGTSLDLSNERIPFHHLREVAGRMAINVGRLRTDDLDLRNARVMVVVKNGSLRLDIVRGSVIGGVLTGKLAVDAQKGQPYLSADLLVVDADLKKALGGKGKKRVPLHTAIRAHGPAISIRGLATNVSGDVMLLIGSDKPGVKLGPVGDLLSGVANSLATIGRITGGELKCVVMHLHFEKGIGRSRLMVIDTQGLTLHGKGVIDLRKKRIDMIFGAWPKVAIIRRFTPFVVRVSGSLEDPRIKLDAGQGVGEAIERLSGLVVLPFKLIGWALGEKPNLETRTEPCPAATEALLRAYNRKPKR